MPTIKVLAEEFYFVYIEIEDRWVGQIELELTDDELRQFRNAETKFWRAQDMISDKIKKLKEANGN